MATETLATGTTTTESGQPAATGQQQTTQQQQAQTTQQGAEQTPEQKAAAEATAKADADKAAAAKTEEERRAKLTDAERKTEDDAKAKAEEQRKANFGAPDKYEFKPAEGRPAADPELSTELSAIAKEFDLSQAAAQRVYDLGEKLVAKHTTALTEQIEKTRNDWGVQSKTDKEFGGDQLDSNLAVARKALDLGTPELREFLNSSGIGNHPEVIRWMYRVGKTLKQDEHVQGGRPGEQKDARSFYPNSNMNP